MTPSSGNVGLDVYLLYGSTARNANSDNMSFNSWAYGTTCESAETMGRHVGIIGLPASTVAQSADTPGAFGSMTITVPAAAGKAPLIGPATAHSHTGGQATHFSFAGGLNIPDSIDACRLLFAPGMYLPAR
jgi:hypothetical protein